MIFLPKIAGVEIGNRAVKIALVRTGLGRPRLLALVQKEIVQRDNESRNSATVRALNDALQQLNGSPDVYVSYMSGRNAVVRVLSVPFTNRKLVASTLKGNLEPHVPLPIDDLVVDFSPINTTDGKTDVLTVAVRKSSLQDHLETLAEAGIDPEVVDLDFASLTALWLRENAVRERKLTVLVHATPDGSLIVIVEGRTMMFLRGMDFSAEDLRNDSEQTAEQILTTLRAFAATSRKTGIDKLVFTGASLSAQQCAALERRLGLSVSVSQLGANLIPPQEVADESADAWAGVIGSAINYSGRSRVGFNFRKGEFTHHSTITDIKRHAVFSGVLIALLVLASAARLQSELRVKSAEKEALDSAIAELFEKTFPGTSAPRGKVLALMERQVKEGEDEYEMYRPYLAGTTSTLDVLHEVITLIPDARDLLVKRLGTNRRVVTVAGQVGDWAMVELIRQQLDNSEFLGNVRVVEQASNRETKKTDFTITAKQL